MGKGHLKRKQALRSAAHRGPCYFKGCNRNGGTIHTCITCEKLNQASPDVGVFQIQCCAEHYQAGLAKVKRHAVIAHPANLIGLIAAGLKGEPI